MRRLSSKLAELSTAASLAGQVLVHYCEGCNQLHMINTSIHTSAGSTQYWNGNPIAPTIAPRITIIGQCYYIITDGKISYDGYSSHSLAGQTVDLPDLPEWLKMD